MGTGIGAESPSASTAGDELQNFRTSELQNFRTKVVAEREGFEPTVGISHDRFQDGSLKPLGHLSVSNDSGPAVTETCGVDSGEPAIS